MNQNLSRSFPNDPVWVLLLALAVTPLGCTGLNNSKSTKGNTSAPQSETAEGNFTKTFVDEVQEFGGRLQKTNDIPIIHSQWTIQKDRNGFECIVNGVAFPELDKMVVAAFATEGIPSNHPALLQNRMFRATDVGVALHIQQTPKGIQLNCLRGQTNCLNSPKKAGLQ